MGLSNSLVRLVRLPNSLVRLPDSQSAQSDFLILFSQPTLSQSQSLATIYQSLVSLVSLPQSIILVKTLFQSLQSDLSVIVSLFSHAFIVSVPNLSQPSQPTYIGRPSPSSLLSLPKCRSSSQLLQHIHPNYPLCKRLAQEEDPDYLQKTCHLSV